MKQGTQYFPALRPLRALSESYSLPKESNPVLEKGFFFNIVFLLLEKLL